MAPHVGQEQLVAYRYAIAGRLASTRSGLPDWRDWWIASRAATTPNTRSADVSGSALDRTQAVKCSSAWRNEP